MVRLPGGNVGQEQRLTELESDLRATAESVSVDAQRLQALEDVKADLAADDPRLVRIAEHAKRLADEISAKASAELSLAEEASATS